MFRMPNEKRINEILTAAPEIISTLIYKQGGYLKRVKCVILLKRFTDELGIKIKYPLSGSAEYMMDLFNDNGIPDFAILETKSGEYKISFGDDSEKDPVIALTRDYWDKCDNGYIYVFCRREVSSGARKCIRRSWAWWYKNLLTGTVEIFH